MPGIFIGKGFINTKKEHLIGLIPRYMKNIDDQ